VYVPFELRKWNINSVRHFKITTMKKELYKGRTKEEVKKILENEGSKGAHQFKEWNDVFDLLSECRRYDLPEIYAWSILSNRFEIKQK
jgi:hypothetical protein